MKNGILDKNNGQKGARTFGIMAFDIMTPKIMILSAATHSMMGVNELCNPECHLSSVILIASVRLSIIMLSVVITSVAMQFFMK